MIKKDDKDAIIEHLKNTLNNVKEILSYYYDDDMCLTKLYRTVENTLNDVSF